MAQGTDERMPSSGAHQVLADMSVLRCSGCGISQVRMPEPFGWMPHGCGGHYQLVTDPLHRAVLLRLMSRQTLGRA